MQRITLKTYGIPGDSLSIKLNPASLLCSIEQDYPRLGSPSVGTYVILSGLKPATAARMVERWKREAAPWRPYTGTKLAPMSGRGFFARMK